MVAPLSSVAPVSADASVLVAGSWLVDWALTERCDPRLAAMEPARRSAAVAVWRGVVGEMRLSFDGERFQEQSSGLDVDGRCAVTMAGPGRVSVAVVDQWGHRRALVLWRRGGLLVLEEGAGRLVFRPV